MAEYGDDYADFFGGGVDARGGGLNFDSRPTGQQGTPFSSDDGDSGSVTGPTSGPPKTGLTKTQFENRFGITDRNPYGQTGFAKFFDKFSKALGGKGVDYRQQFRDLDRLMNRDPGESLARFKKQQYGLYKDPKIAPDGRIISGGIDQANRGTYQGPIEMVPRQMNLGEQLTRAGIGALPVVGPMLSGAGGTDLYLSSRVTPEMRARENPSLAELLRSSLGLGDTIESVANKGTSLIERMQGIVTGQGQASAQDVIPSQPAMRSMDPSREIGPLAQTIPTPIATPIAVEEANPQGPMMPAEFDRRINDNTTAEKLREQPFAEQSDPAMSFTELAPEPKVFDSTLIDQLIAEQQENRDRAAAQREANRDISLELLQGNLSQAIADSQARKMAQTEELDSVAPRPEMSPAEMLREIISQPPSPRTGGQAQVAELDYPELSKIIELGRQLATGEGVGGSTKIFGGDLGIQLNPVDRGIGFQFRKEFQDKDMGAGKFLNFLNRIAR